MYPVLFNSSWFILYSYPLFMGLAFGIGIKLSLALIDGYGETPRMSYGLLISSLVLSWVGAKLFFIVYSSGSMADTYIQSSSFWLGGGFVFFGGFIFGTLPIIFSSFVLKRFNSKNIPLLLPGLCIAHGVGRVGCLLAGCCFGKTTDSLISIHLHGEDRYPVQIYESVLLLILGFVLLKLIKIKIDRVKLVAIYLVSYGIIRFTLEFIRGDKIRGIHFLELSTSQFVSMGLFSIGIGLLIRSYYKRMSR